MPQRNMRDAVKLEDLVEFPYCLEGCAVELTRKRGSRLEGLEAFRNDSRIRFRSDDVDDCAAGTEFFDVLEGIRAANCP